MAAPTPKSFFITMKRKITAYYATRGPNDRDGKEGNEKRQKETPEEVKELLSHIEDSSGWKPSLSSYTSQRSFQTLATFVAAARYVPSRTHYY